MSLAIGIATLLLGWVVVGLVQGTLGPWKRLAQRFRQSRPPPLEQRYRFASARLITDVGTLLEQKSEFGGTLIVGTGPDGLYLADAVFRPFIPPVLVPWDAIRSSERGRDFGQDWVDLVIGDQPEVVMRLFGDAGLAALGGWQFAEATRRRPN